MGGFGIDDWIAAGVMPPATLGIIHSHYSQQSHILKEAVKAKLLSVLREDLSNFLVKPKRIGYDIMVEEQYHRIFGSPVPALANFIYENLVLETWFNFKKPFTVDTRTHNTTS